jgi:hypothetical protein
MLVECLVYIGVLFAILAVVGVWYEQALDHTRGLRRVADDVTRALDAGEHWRADVRAATAPPRLVREGALQALHLPGRDAERVYFFDGSNVVRRAGVDGGWRPFLPNVKSSRFLADERDGVRSWRWEIELAGGRRPARVPPLFTFRAVPSTPSTP